MRPPSAFSFLQRCWSLINTLHPQTPSPHLPPESPTCPSRELLKGWIWTPYRALPTRHVTLSLDSSLLSCFPELSPHTGLLLFLRCAAVSCPAGSPAWGPRPRAPLCLDGLTPSARSGHCPAASSSSRWMSNGPRSPLPPHTSSPFSPPLPCLLSSERITTWHVHICWFIYCASPQL